MSSIKLSQAIDGCLFYKRASGKSQHTIADYKVAFDKLKLYFTDDPAIESITRQDLVGFFAWLRDDYVSHPTGCAPRRPVKLSNKTIQNTHIAISALWTWAIEEQFATHHIVRQIRPPAANAPIIEAFTQSDLQQLLKACERSQSWKTHQGTTNAIPTADRNAAIVMFLVDTGVRASELCALIFSDINFQASSVRITGKGNKQRIVYFGKRASRVLWRYLVPCLSTTANPADPVFTSGHDPSEPLTRNALGQLLSRIGERAGVPNVHPHKFRHTFAINYLRNGGDLFTLQELLGHSDLKMVRRYAHIVQVDCANAHQKASSADNWKL